MTKASFLAQQVIQPSGRTQSGQFEHDGTDWLEFRIDSDAQSARGESYFVPGLPIEFHCHGLGVYDFSEMKLSVLAAVNDLARDEGIRCLPTMYLPRNSFDSFLGMMKEYDESRRAGDLEHLVGVALEGPLFSSFGGTPKIGVWAPTRKEWLALAACGEIGLRYVVLSPDAFLPGSATAGGGHDHPKLSWIIEALLDRGVKPALGHFMKNDSEGSARAILDILEIVERRCAEPWREVITDHLFNDMPKLFKHVWRTREERASREEDLARNRLSEWTFDQLHAQAGAVPATLMTAARDGRLTLCMNLDGEHVDLEICRRAIELLGAERIIAMTDRCDGATLGGQLLHPHRDNGLLYQQEELVACGSCTVDGLMRNLRSIKVSEEQIWEMVSFLPDRVLGIPPSPSHPPALVSFVDPGGKRSTVACVG